MNETALVFNAIDFKHVTKNELRLFLNFLIEKNAYEFFIRIFSQGYKEFANKKDFPIKFIDSIFIYPEKISDDDYNKFKEIEDSWLKFLVKTEPAYVDKLWYCMVNDITELKLSRDDIIIDDKTVIINFNFFKLNSILSKIMVSDLLMANLLTDVKDNKIILKLNR